MLSKGDVERQWREGVISETHYLDMLYFFDEE